MFKHQYRNFRGNFFTSQRAIHMAETPDQVAASFEQKDVTETDKSKINVDQEKQKFIDKLGADKKAPGYQEALTRITTHAEKLKKKQEFYSEKAKAKANGQLDIKDGYAVGDSKAYEKAVNASKALDKLATLKTASGVSDDIDYAAKVNVIKAANDTYLTAVVTDSQAKIEAFNKKLAQIDQPNSGVKLKDLTADLAAMKAKVDEYKFAKSKNFEGSTLQPTTQQKDIEDNYFAAANLYNAKLANEQLKGSDDKVKVEQARQWLAGAVELQGMRTARASAWESWNKLKKDHPDVAAKVDAADHPARKAWDKAVSLEKTDFKEAAKLYAQAKAEYDKALTGKESADKEQALKESKDKAQKAWDSIPASLFSSDGNSFVDAGFFKDFKNNLKADAKYNQEWTDAEAAAKTDPEKAAKSFDAIAKKYAATAASVNAINGVAADVMALGRYDSQEERNKRGGVAQDKPKERYTAVLGKLYESAREEVNYGEHKVGSKYGEAVALYNKLKTDSYYVEHGDVKMTAEPKVEEPPKKTDTV